MTDLPRRLFIFSAVGFGFAASVVWMFYWPADNLYDVSGTPLARDFVNIWSAPQIVARYGVAKLFDFWTYHRAVGELFRSGVPDYSVIWSYPPSMLLVAEPFSHLPYQLAVIAWASAGLVLYAAVVLSRLAPQDRTVGFLALLLAPATLINIVVGQNGFFTAALLLGGVACVPRRPWLGGILFGLLTLKPQLALLAPVALIAIGAWRTLACTAAVAAGLVLISGAVWGIAPWVDWLTRTSPYVYNLIAEFRTTFGYMMPSVFASMRDVGFSPDVANILQAIVALAVIPAVFFAFAKTQDVGLRALVLASGTLLATPYAFNYDMTAITAAILWVMASARPIERRDVAIYGAVWSLPAAIYVLNGLRTGAAAVLLGAAFVTALIRIYASARQDSADRAGQSLPSQQAA